nr:ATP-dependent sacrificial sulfur transferase LarE [uncultured Carboxylicivirga sp.]
MPDFKQKVEKLISHVADLCREDVVVAFSGGVDSSLVLKIATQQAKTFNARVYAVTVQTKLHPTGDLDIAREVADELGAIHRIVEVDELQSAGIGNNPENRCYLCKKFIFTQLINLSKELKVNHILEGTNADDLNEYRPGIQALKELNIISPLVKAGLTKQDIRMLAKEYSIAVANRPSAPCMATRFPYNTALSYEKMECLEKGENYIRDLGFYNVRIRLHNDIARIEVDDQDMEKMMINRKAIIKELKSLGFEYITIDMEGFRSGSMDYKLINKKEYR